MVDEVNRNVIHENHFCSHRRFSPFICISCARDLSQEVPNSPSYQKLQFIFFLNCCRVFPTAISTRFLNELVTGGRLIILGLWLKQTLIRSWKMCGFRSLFSLFWSTAVYSERVSEWSSVCSMITNFPSSAGSSTRSAFSAENLEASIMNFFFFSDLVSYKFHEHSQAK